MSNIGRIAWPGNQFESVRKMNLLWMDYWGKVKTLRETNKLEEESEHVIYITIISHKLNRDGWNLNP